MRVDAYEFAAMAMYAEFARIIDPNQLERRWNGLKPQVQQDWIKQARAAIDAFIAVRDGNGRI